MENLDKLVDAISNEKPVDAEAIFKDEMKSRLTDAIKNKKYPGKIFPGLSSLSL